ncbi:MAG: MMPL family transporter [Methylococcales bacterium]|nr:MMPL family transporter [Methylococcales bacterium]
MRPTSTKTSISLLMLKNKLSYRLALVVTNHPWWTILLSLLIISALGSGVINLTFKNNYRVYFGADNPQLQAFNTMQETYNKTDNVIFILEPLNGDVFEVKTLETVIKLTQDAWKIPYSTRVDSISNFQYSHAIEDNLIVEDLITKPALLTAEARLKIKQIALAEPLLINRLLSKTAHVTTVSVTLELPGKHFTESKEIAIATRRLADMVESSNPNLRVYLTGMAMMDNAFAESAMDDNMTLLPIMYGVLVAVLFLCLRSFSSIFSVILLIVFSVFSALGLATWMGIFLTPTSAISPTIILTMAVADCVHILVTFLHNMRLGHEKKQAMQESIRINFQPIFLTSLTTAIGFLSMNFSDSPPFQHLGNIVAIGVIVAWLLSITLLPALMIVLPLKVRVKDELDNNIMLRLANFTIKNRKPLLIINAVIAISLSCFIPMNELDDQFIKFFDKSYEFRQGTDFLNENVGGIYTLEISMVSKDEGGINDPLYLKNLQKLGDWLLAQPEVVHLNSLEHTFKRLNKNMHGDDINWYKLPENKELAAQYLLLYEMSLPYGLDLNNQININKSGTRSIVIIKPLSSNQILALEQRIKYWLNENTPETKFEIASTVLMFSHLGQRNISRMMIGTTLALVFISFLLMFAFKSVKLGFLSLIPNLLPAAIAFGIWGMVNGHVGLSLSTIIGMTLGIVVDDTVHFISKYQRARVEKNLNSEEAVRYAFSTVGIALWVTSLVLTCGFIVLSQSHFSMNSDMGLMTAITIAVALFLDLLFLPPLLMLIDKQSRHDTA